MTSKRNNSVRIVGGVWRGRRLRFPAAIGLRPTGDRQRETLFNWLGAELDGARCLDLFAGSGALGLEALSRGAAHVVAVDASGDVVRALTDNVARLGAQGYVDVVRSRVERFLSRPGRSAEVVFIDPPYARPALAQAAIARLEANGWLMPHARIYLELPSRGDAPEIPAGWSLRRCQMSGAGQIRLYTKEPA